MGAFYQITDDGFPGAKSIDFIAQYIVGVEPMGRYWFWSSLADARTYNSLDAAQAETSPDRIRGLIVSNNQVLVFGERTIEPWILAPTDTATFQLQVGSVIQSGCASGNTIKRLDNAVYYLTENGQVARLSGNAPQVISTFAMEGEISRCNLAKAFAFTWEDKGHTVYYITFPDGATWGYDVRQGEWHRRKSYGRERWRINALEKSNGAWFAGDFQNGKLYRLDWDCALDGCDPIERIRSTPYVHADGERVTVNGLLVRVDSGLEETTAHGGFNIVGEAPDAYVGDTVNFQYETEGGYPGQGVFTASGEPTGSEVDGAGRLSGTYTEAGEFTITMTAVDDCGHSDTHTDTIFISDTLLPPQLSDWRFLQVAADDATSYSDPDFDDSEWATGPAPFGSWEAGYGAPEIEDGAPDGLLAAHEFDSRFAANFASYWEHNTRLWLRRTLTLTTIPAGGLQVTGYMDDNYLLYINGVLAVTGTSGLEGGGATYTLPAGSLVEGENVLAIRCDDEAPNGAASVVYADFLIELAP